MYVVEQTAKVSSSNISHRPAFTHKSKNTFLEMQEIPEGTFSKNAN